MSANSVYCLCRLEALTQEKLAEEKSAAASAKERKASKRAPAEELRCARQALAAKEKVRRIS